MGEAENGVQIIDHPAELLVNEVEGRDEIRCGNTHEGLDDGQFGSTSSSSDDVGIEFFHDRPVSDVTLIKISDDRVSIHTQGEHEEGRTPAGSVFALCAMPQDSAVFGCLDDESEESSVLELGKLTPDEGGVHIRRHDLHLGIEGIVDNMPVEFEESFVGNGFAGLLLGAHVDGREQMMLHALYLAIGDGLGLAQRTEIEDAAELIFLFESPHVVIGSVVEVSRTDEPMGPDESSTCALHSAQVAGIVDMFEGNGHWDNGEWRMGKTSFINRTNS